MLDKTFPLKTFFMHFEVNNINEPLNVPVKPVATVIISHCHVCASFPDGAGDLSQSRLTREENHLTSEMVLLCRVSNSCSAAPAVASGLQTETQRDQQVDEHNQTTCFLFQFCCEEFKTSMTELHTFSSRVLPRVAFARFSC